MQRLHDEQISKLANVLVARERLALRVRQNENQLDDTVVSAASEKCNFTLPRAPSPPGRDSYI